MRAVVLDSQGPPSVLRVIEDYPKPELQPQRVLLRVKAIAIGQSDLMTRRGFTAGPKVDPPKILGSECVAVIEAVSPELTRDEDAAEVETRSGPEGAKYRVGDVVMALMAGMGRFFDGCYAEYVSVPPACLSPPLGSLSPSISPSLPSSTFALLATLPCAFLAAYGVLATSLHIRSDDTLLIHSGSSAMGMAAATLAKNVFGVLKVVGTTRSIGKVERMRTSGFDVVVVLAAESSQAKSAAEVAALIKKEAQELEGFSAQIELIGANHIQTSYECAKALSGSRICMAGMLAGDYHVTGQFSPMGIPVGVSLCGYSSSFKYHLLPLKEIVPLAMEGRGNVTLDKVFRFEDIVLAHEYCEDNQSCGKVVCMLE